MLFSNIEILREKRDQECRILNTNRRPFVDKIFYLLKKIISISFLFSLLPARVGISVLNTTCRKKTSRCCPSYDNVDGKFEDLNKGMKMKRKTRETSLHSAHFSHLSEAEEQRWYGSECPSCFRVVVVKICKREIRKEIIAQPKCEEYEGNKEIVQFVRFYQNNR